MHTLLNQRLFFVLWVSFTVINNLHPPPLQSQHDEASSLLPCLLILDCSFWPLSPPPRQHLASSRTRPVPDLLQLLSPFPCSYIPHFATYRLLRVPATLPHPLRASPS